MRTLAVSVIALLLLTGVSVSQPAGVGDNSRAVVVKHRFGAKYLTKARKKQLELEAAHKAALNKIPTPPAPTDPWAKMRPAKASANSR
jgi:hypothetical protein